MFEKYIEYGLHDTSVNNIVIEESGLTFVFQDGVYILNDAKKETELSKPCKMCIDIECFEKNKLFVHCSFYKCNKNHFSEVEFQ